MVSGHIRGIAAEMEEAADMEGIEYGEGKKRCFSFPCFCAIMKPSEVQLQGAFMYKVVIVDDEPVIVRGLTQIIDWSKWNCEVVGTAESGQEGMVLISEKKPDILFSDINMPGLDGLNMIAALRSEYERMQITILTGYRDFDYAQRAIRLGVTRFLLKPSKIDEIEEAISAMIEKLKELDLEEKNSRGHITEELQEEDTALQDAGEEEAAASRAESVAEEGPILFAETAALKNQEKEPETEQKTVSDTLQANVTEKEDGTEDPKEQDLEEDASASSFIVKNALAYIEENYKQKLKLADVAEKTYVSQWHLSKLLNKQTGQNFSEILNNVRIEKAKELLKDPALRIGDVAEAVGFLDMAHFSRVFKKQAGISANEYRNKILGKKL